MMSLPVEPTSLKLFQALLQLIGQWIHSDLLSMERRQNRLQPMYLVALSRAQTPVSMD